MKRPTETIDSSETFNVDEIFEVGSWIDADDEHPFYDRFDPDKTIALREIEIDATAFYAFLNLFRKNIEAIPVTNQLIKEPLRGLIINIWHDGVTFLQQGLDATFGPENVVFECDEYDKAHPNNACLLNVAIGITNPDLSNTEVENKLRNMFNKELLKLQDQPENIPPPHLSKEEAQSMLTEARNKPKHIPAIPPGPKAVTLFGQTIHDTIQYHHSDNEIYPYRRTGLGKQYPYPKTDYRCNLFLHRLKAYLTEQNKTLASFERGKCDKKNDVFILEIQDMTRTETQAVIEELWKRPK